SPSSNPRASAHRRRSWEDATTRKGHRTMPKYELYHAKANATVAAKKKAKKPYNITIRFLGGLTERQKSAFKKAADRWTKVIVGDLPPVMIDGEKIDDILILAEGAAIDGP